MNRSDNINRPDNASSLGSPSDGGGGYTLRGTSVACGIFTNFGYFAAGSGVLSATLDAGTGDATVSLKLTNVGSSSGACARVSSNGNGIYALCSTTQVTLQKIVGGTPTTLGSYSGAVAHGSTIELVASGAQLSVRLNGAQVIAPVTDALNQAEVNHGVGTSNGGSALYFDDLAITDTSTPATAAMTATRPRRQSRNRSLVRR